MKKILSTGLHKHEAIASFILLSVMVTGLVSGCAHSVSSQAAISTGNSSQATLTAQKQETLVTSTLTPTSEPLALTVNGMGISLAEYQAELSQYQAALSSTGTPVATTTPAVTPSVTSGTEIPKVNDQQKAVIEDLIDEALLAQAAEKAGHSVSEADLATQVTQLATQTTNSKGLAGWEAQFGYTDASFKEALKRSLEAAWERDQITSQVPTTAAQVHARQILVFTEADADAIITKLKSGTDFATLAYYYESNTGGDLGWFPKGYLMESAMETAAFSLKTGQYSDVIKTSVGYVILYVVETDPNHALSAQARMVLQKEALQQWLTDQRSKAKITVLLP